ncbi:hypothetical protein RRG08_028583 [Elysia crispata]|uniref:Uncharacterized protein n=1 Tax=Elysia crispata TaxID=231223 RepID=A0AAE1DWT9_9GAST|nr:hypothetical protein RRG08_028583 [Elysia crispata]
MFETEFLMSHIKWQHHEGLAGGSRRYSGGHMHGIRRSESKSGTRTGSSTSTIASAKTLGFPFKTPPSLRPLQIRKSHGLTVGSAEIQIDSLDRKTERVIRKKEHHAKFAEAVIK